MSDDVQVLDLTAEEYALYRSLVAAGPTVPAELAGTATFARLAERGLVAHLSGDATRWIVVSPQAAFEPEIAARRRELHEFRLRIARLADRFHHTTTASGAELVEVIDGPQEVRGWFNRLLRTAEREVLICDTPPYVKSVRFSDNPGDLRPGVRIRTLHAPESVAIPGRLAIAAATVATGEQLRVGEVPMKLVLSDRRTGMVPLQRRPTVLDSALLVRDPALVAALVALFESYFDRAVPLDLGVAQLPPDADRPTKPERDLLTLLMAGLTDQAIADQLGCHVSTVRRRQQQLFARLGATTRFQAGYQAVQRGWLTAAERSAG
ncbi:helix-turn-helix transcriptional regulator [Kribbella shirazensis]|uniref:DNA-binding NarL/FixJ family response regulator n=1 Tax=Kribbella shirazensis TaxID=1105143 RepID=A0A7X5V6B2_9ACTN|nr:LuxR family transcriptional regulator [Kribbella shirazensis]NIK55377.1 DNA-binding NarL/FixJ family response regulator [Kribbella shirazensis]